MKLNKEILRLAAPSILANITVPLVGMVDMAVVGHLGGLGPGGVGGVGGGLSGAALIGGISVGTMLFDLLYWNFAFLRAGTGGLTAQAYGRHLAALASSASSAPSASPSPAVPGANSPSGAPGQAKIGSPSANSASGAPGQAKIGSPSANLASGAPGQVINGRPGANLASGAPGIGTILGRALRIALLSGLGLIALQWVVVQLAFLVVQCTPEVRLLATQYFYIRVWAAPATLSLFALKGWFIGLQDTLRPMLVDLLVNLVNIVLSIGLGFGVAIPITGSAWLAGILPAAWLHGGSLTLLPALGFSGVAIGTVIAQWAGFILALALASKYLKLIKLLKTLVQKTNDDFQQSADTQQLSSQPSAAAAAASSAPSGLMQPSAAAVAASSAPSGLMQPSAAATGLAREPELARAKAPAAETGDGGSFFRLNRDLFLRSVGMIAVYIGFTVLAARLGDLMLALSAILMKLLMLFSYFSDGFAYAGEALTGRFIGEQSADGVRSTVRGTFLWGAGVAALFMLLYGFGGVPLLRLMTSDASVVEAGRAFLPWLLLMPLIGCPAFIWDGIFIGATASKDLRNSTLLCAVAFFAVWFIGIGLVPSASAALHLLMVAYFAHLAIRAAYLTLRYRPAVLSNLCG